MFHLWERRSTEYRRSPFRLPIARAEPSDSKARCLPSTAHLHWLGAKVMGFHDSDTHSDAVLGSISRWPLSFWDEVGLPQGGKQAHSAQPLIPQPSLTLSCHSLVPMSVPFWSWDPEIVLELTISPG